MTRTSSNLKRQAQQSAVERMRLAQTASVERTSSSKSSSKSSKTSKFSEFSKTSKTSKFSESSEIVKPHETVKFTETFKPYETLESEKDDPTKREFKFKIEDESSPMEAAMKCLETMFAVYVMSLVYKARPALVSIIRAKDPDVLSAVDIKFDPDFPFSIKIMNEDGTYETITRSAHEILYGTICEYGEWTGHWMKYRRGYATALNNWNKIQCFVFSKFRFYLSDVSTEKSVVSIMIANRFGQLQLSRANKGYQFWHRHVFLPPTVYETLSPTYTRTIDLKNLPDFVDIPFDEDFDPETDFENMEIFTRGMMRVMHS